MRKTKTFIGLNTITNNNLKPETFYSLQAKINDARFLYENGSMTKHDYRNISKQLNEVATYKLKR
jgi:hypothetical protein